MEINKSLFIQRLTTLWALNEAGLGGLMHALRIPFTGVIIGGTAAILISLIAYFAQPNFKVILKSMVIVLIVKAIVSPYSPINAYFAVLFQGILGFFLFTLIRNLKIASFLLSFLALFEGAVQKIVVLTIIYGTSLWRALDLFFDSVLSKFSLQTNNLSLSLFIIGLYLTIHIIGGILIGLLCLKFINLMQFLPERLENLPSLKNSLNAPIQVEKKKNKHKKVLKISILLLFILATFTFFSSNDGLWQGLFVFFRVLVLIVLWYFFIGPFLMKRLHVFLKNKSKTYSKEVEHIHEMLPFMQKLVFTLWKESTKFTYLKRWKFFLSNLILFSLVIDTQKLDVTTTEAINNEQF